MNERSLYSSHALGLDPSALSVDWGKRLAVRTYSEIGVADLYRVGILVRDCFAQYMGADRHDTDSKYTGCAADTDKGVGRLCRRGIVH